MVGLQLNRNGQKDLLVNLVSRSYSPEEPEPPGADGTQGSGWENQSPRSLASGLGSKTKDRKSQSDEAAE